MLAVELAARWITLSVMERVLAVVDDPVIVIELTVIEPNCTVALVFKFCGRLRV